MSKWYISEGIPPFTQAGWEVKTRDSRTETYWFQTEEWAQLCADHFNRLDQVNPFNRITISTITDGFAIASRPFGLYRPAQSEWICHLFGSNGQGISWSPNKGEEPNWFWRKMQYLCFGNKWVKR
jgi:hypothetical protein